MFVPFDRAGDVVSALGVIGFTAEQPVEKWSPAAGVRLRQADDPTRLDVFFSLDNHYDEIARRTERFPFGRHRRHLPFLSAEDLVVFKLSFGRDKDWVDIRHLVEARPDIDLDYVEAQLIGLRGPTLYPRLARLRAITRRARGEA